jgi:Sulfotransferase domain
MRPFLRPVKECLPPAWRTRIRKVLARVPLARRLAHVQVCPWQVGFVVGGTMKGGTTALSAFLDQHPEIHMARGKEAHFFDTDEHFRPGCQPDYGLYHRHFSPGPGTRLLGDATPIYLYWEPAPARVAAYNPRMKWLLLLRQPAERAYSHWNMLRLNGAEPLAFDEAVARAAERANLPAQCRIFSYLDRGFYARQLRRLFAVVPRRQVLVLRSEELRRDHHATLRRIFEFLSIDAGVRGEPAVIHPGRYDAHLPVDHKRELTAHFIDDIRDLEYLLGWDLSDWLTV